jgi:hypothetical protein
LYSNPTFGLSETKTKLNPALLQETEKKIDFFKRKSATVKSARI